MGALQNEHAFIEEAGQPLVAFVAFHLSDVKINASAAAARQSFVVKSPMAAAIAKEHVFRAATEALSAYLSTKILCFSAAMPLHFYFKRSLALAVRAA